MSTEALNDKCDACHGSGRVVDGLSEGTQCPFCYGTGLVRCIRHCTVCEGSDHHWLPDYDEEEGDTEMVMRCKHCDAKREIGDCDDEH